MLGRWMSRGTKGPPSDPRGAGPLRVHAAVLWRRGKAPWRRIGTRVWPERSILPFREDMVPFYLLDGRWNGNDDALSTG